MSKKKRRNVRVKLPIRQAHLLAATLYNVQHMPAGSEYSETLRDHIRECARNVEQAIAHRNRVTGMET